MLFWFYSVNRSMRSASDWPEHNALSSVYNTLDELTVGILGLGEIGRATAKAFKVISKAH